MKKPGGWSAASVAGGVIVATGWMAASSGCSTASSERHYFRAVDAENKPVNYFRLTIKSSSSLASSRYLSGYFDEQAVDQYFGSFKQPTQLNFVPELRKEGAPEQSADQKNYGDKDKEPSPSANIPASKTAVAVKPLSPDLEGRKLVILLSSNSDDIASQITTIADGGMVSSYIGALAAKDIIIAGQDAQAKYNQQVKSMEIVTAIGNKLLTTENLKVDDKSQSEASQAAVVQVAGQLAASLGARRSFANMEDVRIWLNNNRGRILAE